MIVVNASERGIEVCTSCSKAAGVSQMLVTSRSSQAESAVEVVKGMEGDTHWERQRLAEVLRGKTKAGAGGGEGSISL